MFVRQVSITSARSNRRIHACQSGDEVAGEFASQRVGEAGIGCAFVDSVFDGFDGDPANFARSEVTQAHDAFIFGRHIRRMLVRYR